MSTSQPLIDNRKLRLKRVGAGLTQPALAELAGLHPSHISLLERGLRGTSLETLEALAEALGCRTGDLMPDLTPAELAELAELHPGFIQMLERGGHGLSPERLGVVADVFGCDIADLMREARRRSVRPGARCARCEKRWTPQHSCKSSAPVSAKKQADEAA